MIFYKVNVEVFLGDISIRGSVYMESAPSSPLDLEPIIPKWVQKVREDEGKVMEDCTTFQCFQVEITKEDVLSMPNDMEAFTVHDTFEELLYV